MELAVTVIAIGAIVFLAHLFSILFERTKVPDVLPLVTIGLILGPILGLATQEHLGEVGPVFSNLTLVLILFESGLNMKLTALKDAVRPASILGIAFIAFFAYYEIDGKPAGLALWALFGTTNQILAGLALLVITIYLLKRGWQWYIAGIPMVLLLGVTIHAMIEGIHGFIFREGGIEWPLTIIGTFLLILAVWLIVEAVLAVWRFKKRGILIEDYEVEEHH